MIVFYKNYTKKCSFKVALILVICHDLGMSIDKFMRSLVQVLKKQGVAPCFFAYLLVFVLLTYVKLTHLSCCLQYL